MFLNLNLNLNLMDAQIYLDNNFMLDCYTGLFKLGILQTQRVVISGKYRENGFNKFGVYCIIVLANKHSSPSPLPSVNTP